MPWSPAFGKVGRLGNDFPGPHLFGDDWRGRIDIPEENGDPFQGKGEGEQAQSGEDDECSADQIEESEDCIAEEGDAKAELEQKEHGRVWYVFMLSYR